jgi:predicted transposase/invertase (TIGR01784 family)
MLYFAFYKSDDMAKVIKSETAQKTPVATTPTTVEGTAIVEESMGRYINPLTDFGFKRIFGEEANKDLLIHFLNSVLEIDGQIISLNYRNPEQKGRIKTTRNAFFDLYCITGKGEHIIIEMQKIPQPFFKDRVLYYITFPIQKQAKKGKWDFKLKAVYSVNILNFSFSGNADAIHYVQLMCRKTLQVFYEKLAMVFIELPDFNKTVDELQTNHERWLYVLKHLAALQDMPEALKNNPIFRKLFMEAEIANMTPEELDEYDQSLKNYKDMYTTADIVKSYQKEVAVLTKNNADKDRRIADKDRRIADKDRRITELEQLVKRYKEDKSAK